GAGSAQGESLGGPIQHSGGRRWLRAGHAAKAVLTMRAPIPAACHAAAILLGLLLTASGCSLVPDVRHAQRLHNPFPQLKRVAVLPFYNQSDQPTLNGDAVADAYYAALQAIPGFEVLPVGVVRAQLQQYAHLRGEP